MGKFGLPAKYEVWQMIYRESIDGLHGGIGKIFSVCRYIYMFVELLLNFELIRIKFCKIS